MLEQPVEINRGFFHEEIEETEEGRDDRDDHVHGRTNPVLSFQMLSLFMADYYFEPASERELAIRPGPIVLASRRLKYGDVNGVFSRRGTPRKIRADPNKAFPCFM